MKKAISYLLIFAFLLWQGNVIHIHDHEQNHKDHPSHQVVSHKSHNCSNHESAPISHQHISEDCQICDFNTRDAIDLIHPLGYNHFLTQFRTVYFFSTSTTLLGSTDLLQNKSPPAFA